MKVLHSDAIGGIIITASHNPFNWNALKLLNEKGEFLSAEEGEKILLSLKIKTYYFQRLLNWENAFNKMMLLIFI